MKYVARYPMWAMGRGQSLTRSTQALSASARSGAARRLRRAFDAMNDRRILAQARTADVVYLVKADSPALVRALRQTTKARLVYDLADIRRGDPHEAGLVEEVFAIRAGLLFAADGSRHRGNAWVVGAELTQRVTLMDGPRPVG